MVRRSLLKAEKEPKVKTKVEQATTSLMIKFRFWDRVRILFGWNFAIRVTSLFEYSMKGGLKNIDRDVKEQMVKPGTPNPFLEPLR